MTTDNSAAEYASRCIRALGLTANDTERAIIWCYDNPPKRPLPKVAGERNRQLWISQMNRDGLDMMAESLNGGEATGGMVDALANAIITQFIKDNRPEILDFYERMQTERLEIKKKLSELRHKEPTLQPEEA